MRYILALDICRLFSQAARSTFLATVVLQSIAKAASRPDNDSRRWISIHSEISKLLSPVNASIPRRWWKLDLEGRFEPPTAPIVELVTQGGFPTTRIGAGRSARVEHQSCSKKSAQKTVASRIA